MIIISVTQLVALKGLKGGDEGVSRSGLLL